MQLWNFLYLDNWTDIHSGQKDLSPIFYQIIKPLAGSQYAMICLKFLSRARNSIDQYFFDKFIGEVIQKTF